MKRTLLTILAAFAALTVAEAQTTIVDLNFDTAEQFDDIYSFDADGDGNVWGNTIAPVEGADEFGVEGGFAFSASWDPDTETPLTPDNIIVSAPFSIPEGSTNVDATFRIGALDPSFFAEHYAIYVVPATEATDLMEEIIAEEAEILQLIELMGTPLFEETLTTATVAEKVINLDAYEGQSVRLVLRHFDCTDKYFLAWDGLNVVATELGVSDFVSSQIKVYPNPVRGLLNISANASVSPKEIRISDLNGRTIETMSLNGLESQISTSNLASGIYSVEVITDKGTAVKKIVKE